MTPAQLVRPEILALKAYHVAEAEGMVKLDAMENPYPLPGPLREELARVLAGAELNRYPEPSGRRLRELIARKMQVPARRCVSILGSGPAELSPFPRISPPLARARARLASSVALLAAIETADATGSTKR